MSDTIWLGVAAVGAVLFAVGLVRWARLHRRQDGMAEELPPTLLQKRAWLGLTVASVTALAIVAVFLVKGATTYMEDRGMRLVVLGVFFLGLLCYGIMLRRTRSPEDVDLDERDRAILARASSVQLWAVFLTLAAWAISLTEMYWDRGSIPIAYPYLIFESCVVVNLIAWPAGILLGYRREELHGQG